LNKFAPPKRLQGIEKSVIRQVFDRARPGSINLGLGEPDLPTPDVIRRAAVKAIVEEQMVTLRTPASQPCVKKLRLSIHISSNA
jgi:aspartate aminotransferase